MDKQYKAAIYLFNRDIRIQDNECLTNAINYAHIVYPIFIFTNEQAVHNKYMNIRSLSFMASSLIELANQIPLCFFLGNNNEVIDKLIKSLNIDVLYNNIDVTPFAINRSNQIAALCKKNKIAFNQGNDIFIGRHINLTKSNGDPYLKYTPFYNNAKPYINRENIIAQPKLTNLRQITQSQNLQIPKKYVLKYFPMTIFIPGRKAAEGALKKYTKTESNYLKMRDLPAKNSTTHLSAYLHFGILGPIEVALTLKQNKNHKDIVRQLLWREFYLYIIWKQHTNYTKQSRTIMVNNKIQWRKSASDYKKWCSGETGCPIVDAGMRELNKTGYMQNRLRMIVAMYLTFYLKLDWRLGEKYFAQNLVDYDYCNNLGGWLWSASWEVHSNDYYRVFSMSSQMKRFDPDAEYVKKWAPELNDIPARELYDWDLNYVTYPNVKYPVPLIKNLSESRKKGINIYAKVHSKRK